MKSMNQERVDLLIQYILSVAAQGWGDYDDKEIGPIHIVKYVYLADLAYAKKHGGKTFTGIPWRFHHFGPWDTGLYQRIDPAARAIGAGKKTITDTPYDDFDRWFLDDEHLKDKLWRQLPNDVYLAIDANFRKFGTDTYDLLDFVYSTAPMRHAAPEEPLPFIVAAREYEQQLKDNEELKKFQPKTLTPRERKKRKKVFRDLKAKIQAKIAEEKESKQSNFVTPSPPRYDDLFWKGQEWIDSLAGEPISAERGKLTVSDSVWTSQSRSEPHV